MAQLALARLLQVALISALATGIAQAQEQDGAGLPAPKKADYQGPFPDGVPELLSREDISEPLDRAVNFLVTSQRENGTWGSSGPESTLEMGFALETYYSWQLASQGLVCQALASVPETPEIRASLDKAIEYLCTARMSTRGSDWDVDYVWTAVYGFTAIVDLLDDPRLARGPQAEMLEKRGKEFLEVLLSHQALSGGWAYYDFAPYDRVPTWATSFTTAVVVPAMIKARDRRGWHVPPRVLERAIKYLQRCAMPGGAYSYDLTPTPRISGVEHINLVEGSLGRIQVCNWALVEAGDPHITVDVLRDGLELLFKNHGFLDQVRTRPIPHEGFHSNAGYFYFFAHYYAARVIDLLPEEEREGWHARLRPHLVKTQWANGGMSDFLKTTYLVNASTSFTILSLNQGLAPEERVSLPAGEASDER
ncbi:MAG: hypothetical protein ACI8QC_003880 [Planctomycetota bacterium]